MEDRSDKAFIAFLDDDNQKREDWVEFISKTDSYIEFKYKGKIVLIPWTRILKVKLEDNSNAK